MIFEIGPELLPRDSLPRFREQSRDIALVCGIGIAFEVRPLASDHHDTVKLAAIGGLLHNEVRIHFLPFITLNRKILRANSISKPPQHVGMFVETKRDLTLVGLSLGLVKGGLLN